MKANTFKRKLAAEEPQIGIWSTLPYPIVSELLAGAGYDWMLLDTEHSPSDPVVMVSQLQAVAAEKNGATAAVVRPAWNDPVLIKRYLDIGAHNLLIPYVQSAEEARAAVAATRYPPAGYRGVGGTTRATRFGRDGAYIHEANDQTCVLVQVETSEALDRIEEIASVDGVDGVFIGPADLSSSMGYAGQPMHPHVTAAINGAMVRIRACGKAPGILFADEDRARQCLELGALFVAVAVDQVILRAGADKIAAAFKRNPINE